MSANCAVSFERAAAMNAALSAPGGLASVMVVNPSADGEGLPELTTWRRVSDRCTRPFVRPDGSGSIRGTCTGRAHPRCPHFIADDLEHGWARSSDRLAESPACSCQ